VKEEGEAGEGRREKRENEHRTLNAQRPTSNGKDEG
jgi:hypothetical protein